MLTIKTQVVGERFLPTMAWNNTGTQYKEQKLNFPPKFNVSNFTFHCTNIYFNILTLSRPLLELNLKILMSVFNFP